jgi:2-methylcitrate dehydratase
VKNHTVKVYPSKQELKREDQLAWKLAAVAADPVEVDADVTDMIINRMIDNASVANSIITTPSLLPIIPIRGTISRRPWPSPSRRA